MNDARQPFKGAEQPLVERRFASAMHALAGAQKSSKGAPAYSRFVNRKLGRVLAAMAYLIGMTPNQVTVLSAAFTYAAIVILAVAPPTIFVSVVIALLLIIGYALDAADGQLARLRGGGSLAGEWLDHIADAVKSSVLHAAVLICWFRFFDLDHWLLLVPLGYEAVTAIFFFGMILTDLLRRVHRGTSAIIIRQKGPSSFLYSLAVVPADYGVMCLLFMLLWWQQLFVVLYLLLFVANALILVGALARWYREMKTLT